MSDIWKQLEDMRQTFSPTIHLSQEALQAMIDEHKAVVDERDALLGRVNQVERERQEEVVKATFSRGETDRLAIQLEASEQRVEELEAHILSLTDRLDKEAILDSVEEIQDWHNDKPIPCRFHDYDQEACETYSGDVPCEPYPTCTLECDAYGTYCKCNDEASRNGN